MATVPRDVIFDILSLLPAKFVIRFKSVCKLWYDLINDPDFIKLHLERSLATRSNLHFVIRNPTLHLADFDTFDNPVELDYPFKRPDYGGVDVVGSCRGLLFLWNYDHHLSLFLYNPTTRTHKMLPFLPRAYPRGNVDYGFGYDSFAGDYKCVRILQVFDKETRSFESEVMVYSLKADSWRRVQDDVPYYFYCRGGGNVLVGGAIHWVGQDDNGVYLPIVSFDLKDETFSSIPLPNFDDETVNVNMSVGVLDGCLCLMTNDFEHYDIWMMKENGRPESWMRLFSVRKRNNYEDGERIVSFSISKKELFLRVCLFQIAKLDLETMEVTDVKVADFRRCSGAWVCVENLVMLNDECDDPVSEQEQGRRKRKKKSKKKKRRKSRRLK